MSRRLPSVSYTHLDVYKRQEYRFMDRMGDEHHRQVLLLPETQQIAIELIARNFIQLSLIHI